MSWLRQVFVIMCAVSEIELEYVAEKFKFGSGLLFPEITTVGFFVAGVVPLELVHTSAFVSYGFEEYYALPYKNYQWFPPDSARCYDEDKHQQQEQLTNTTTVHKRELHRTLLTRKRIYKIIENHFELLGGNGQQCLLRTICEISAMQPGEHNGVLGDILEVIFRPTTSQEENLEDVYYQAEFDGFHHNRNTRSCDSYQNFCPTSLLDMISKEFHF